MAGTIYGSGFPITPNDNADIPQPCTGLYVGGAGVLVVVTLNNVEVTFGGVPAGAILPIQVRRVKVTGTTATLIVGLTTG